ncbi:MAG: hypothetical protein IT195_13510 [Microthrixaceae bacterium]|nr:hypothetical protein [Microthrixaceae bacterium]
MALRRKVFDEGELDALLVGGRPSTQDEVSITNDGRRLDSAEAVIEFFEELREQRASSTGSP